MQFDYSFQVFCPHPECCGISLGIDGDFSALEILVDEDGHLPLGVVEDSQWRDRSGFQAKVLAQLFLRGKGKRPALDGFPELFQVDALVSFDDDQVVVPFLVVTKEQVLGDSLGVLA